MKYPNGTDAKLGDRVQFSNGENGIIVFSADTDEYSDEFTKGRWGYLKKGVMIKTDNGALVHYEDPNIDEIILVGK